MKKVTTILMLLISIGCSKESKQLKPESPSKPARAEKVESEKCKPIQSVKSFVESTLIGVDVEESCEKNLFHSTKEISNKNGDFKVLVHFSKISVSPLTHDMADVAFSEHLNVMTFDVF